MTKWIEDHTEADLDELAQAIALKIKNANIEGLTYRQQEALVRSSVVHADIYLNSYRKKMREKS